jgi:hypothetical protein
VLASYFSIVTVGPKRVLKVICEPENLRDVEQKQTPRTTKIVSQNAVQNSLHGQYNAFIQDDTWFEIEGNLPLGTE